MQWNLERKRGSQPSYHRGTPRLRNPALIQLCNHALAWLGTARQRGPTFRLRTSPTLPRASARARAPWPRHPPVVASSKSLRCVAELEQSMATGSAVDEPRERRARAGPDLGEHLGDLVGVFGGHQLAVGSSDRCRCRCHRSTAGAESRASCGRADRAKRSTLAPSSASLVSSSASLVLASVTLATCPVRASATARTTASMSGADAAEEIEHELEELPPRSRVSSRRLSDVRRPDPWGP